MKGLHRFLPWWIIVLGVLLGSVWVFRVEITETALSTVISNLEIEDTEFELSAVDLSSISFATLTTQLTTPTYDARLEFEDITLSYGIEQLLNGEFGSAQIGRAHINHQQQNNNSKTDTKGLIVSDILAGITSITDFNSPLDHFEIEQLTLSSNDQVLAAYSPIQLIGKFDTQSVIHLIHNNWKATFQVSGSEIKLDLIQTDGGSIAQTTMQFRSSENKIESIDGDFDVDTASLISVFEIENHTIPGQPASGIISASFNIRPYENSRLLANVEINVDQLVAGKANGSQLALQSRLYIPDEFDWQGETLVDVSDLNLSIEHLELLGTDNSSIKLENTSFQGSAIITMEQNNYQINTPVSAKFNSDSLKTETISAQQLEWQASILFKKQNQTAIFTILPEATVYADSLITNNLKLTNPDLRIIEEMRTLFKNEEWIIDNGNITLGNTRFSHDQLSGHAEFIAVDIGKLSQNEWLAKIEADQLTVDNKQTIIHFDQTSIDASQLANNVNAKGLFSLDEIDSEFEFDLKAEDSYNRITFSANSVTPVDLTTSAQAIIQQLPVKDSEISFHDGYLDLNISGAITNNKISTISAKFGLDKVSGSYGDIAFKDLNIDSDLSYPFSDKNLNNSAQINIGALEYGTKLSNIAMQIQLESRNNSTLPSVFVESIDAEILGGSLQSGNFTYDPKSSDTKLDINISSLDIEKVVELQQIEGLSATGKVDGVLPLEIGDKGMRVHNGHFTNQKGGGKIQYDIDPSLTESLDNPLTDTVIKALSEFDYEVLQADVSYQHDGELLINFHIEGHSPGLGNNQPVHLNINSEQNVLSLLKSLEYTNKLNNEIDNKFQKSKKD